MPKYYQGASLDWQVSELEGLVMAYRNYLVVSCLIKDEEHCVLKLSRVWYCCLLGSLEACKRYAAAIISLSC
jgi:hypothetical protein